MRSARRPMRRSRSPQRAGGIPRRRAPREGAHAGAVRSRNRPSCSPLKRRRLAFRRRQPIPAHRTGAVPAEAAHALHRRAASRESFRRPNRKTISPTALAGNLTAWTFLRLSGSFVIARNTAFALQGQEAPTPVGDRQGAGRPLRAGRFRCSAIRTRCASTRSSSTPPRAGISGLSVCDKPLSNLFSACKTRSSPVWPANWGSS